MTGRAKYLGAIWLCAVSLLGCTHNPVGQPGLVGDEASLDAWVERQLAPYLDEKLRGQPRFMGESVALVKMSRQDIQPDIDLLTLSVRERLVDHLLSRPGIKMPWHPSRSEARHHRHPSELQCRNSREATYYIGLDIESEGSGNARASVRALDTREKQWVSGFGLSWHGRLTPREEALLGQQQSDEYLRGLRVLPFTAEQPDLVAAYLANNLSCLLRQQSEGVRVLYVQPQSGLKPEASTVLALMRNYLSQLREVTVSDAATGADGVLRLDVHTITPDLDQLWVTIVPTQSGRRLAGVDTAAYVHSAAGAVPLRARVPRDPPERGAAAAVAAGTERRAVPAVEIRRPSHSGPCREGDLTRAGTVGVRGRGSVPADGCFAVGVETEDQAPYVFVLAHLPGKELRRLYPGNCRSESMTGSMGLERRWIEVSPQMDVAGWRGTVPFAEGVATVYALSVRDPVVAQRLRRHLQVLPDGCDAAVDMVLTEFELDGWLSRLDWLVSENREEVSWSARRFNIRD